MILYFSGTTKVNETSDTSTTTTSDTTTTAASEDSSKPSTSAGSESQDVAARVSRARLYFIFY